MFGIGTTELLVVAVLALLLFSPRELPKIIRSISQFWGSIRRTADEFRDAIMQEEAMQDLKDAVDGTKAQLRDAEGAARRELMKARMEARRAENKLVKVARERERVEREAAAKTAAEEGSGQGDGADGSGGEAGESAPTGGVTPAGGAASSDVATPAKPPLVGRDVGAKAPVRAPAPTGTVASGSSAAPESVEPRHAGGKKASGDDPDGGASAQGAA